MRKMRPRGAEARGRRIRGTEKEIARKKSRKEWRRRRRNRRRTRWTEREIARGER